MVDGRAHGVRQRIAIGNKYRIHEDGTPILESARKTLRLTEDVRFTDPDSGAGRFRVTADSVLDVVAAHDIVDSETGTRSSATATRSTPRLIVIGTVVADATEGN
jgi:hypothetical protein